MDHDVMVIGILVIEILRPAYFLSSACVVDFFTQIPVQSQVVTEAGDQFSVIQFTLSAEISAIEQKFIFRFHSFEVQEHTETQAVPLQKQLDSATKERDEFKRQMEAKAPTEVVPITSPMAAIAMLLEGGTDTNIESLEKMFDLYERDQDRQAS